MNRLVVVQAIDGRWNYGPIYQENLMRSEEFGTYETKWDAHDAMIEAVDKMFKEACTA